MSKRKPFEKLVENKLPKAAASPSSSLSSRSSRSSNGSRGSRVVPVLDDRDCGFLSDDKKASVTNTTRAQIAEPVPNTTAAPSSKPVPFTSQTKTPKLSNVTIPLPPPHTRDEANKIAVPKPQRTARQNKAGDVNTDECSVHSDTSQNSRTRRGKRRRRQTIAAPPRPEEYNTNSGKDSLKLPVKSKLLVARKQRASLSALPSLQTIVEEGEEVSSPEAQEHLQKRPPLPPQHCTSSSTDNKLVQPKTAAQVYRDGANPPLTLSAQNTAAGADGDENDDMDLGSSDEESLVSPGESGAVQATVESSLKQNPAVAYKTPTELGQTLDFNKPASDPSRNTNPAASKRPTAAQSFPAGSKQQRDKLRQICLFTPSQLVEGFQSPAASKTSPKKSSSGKRGNRQHKESVLASLKPPSTPNHGKPFSGDDLHKYRMSQPDNAAVMQALLAESKGESIDREESSLDRKNREPVSIKTVVLSGDKKNPSTTEEEEDDVLSELTYETTGDNVEARAKTRVQPPSRPATPVPTRRKSQLPRRKSEVNQRRTESAEREVKPLVPRSTAKITQEAAPPMKPSISPADSSNFRSETDAAIKSLQLGGHLARTMPSSLSAKSSNPSKRKDEKSKEPSSFSSGKEAAKPENAKRQAISKPRPESKLAAASNSDGLSSGREKAFSQNRKDEEVVPYKSNFGSRGVSPLDKQGRGQSPEMNIDETSRQQESQKIHEKKVYLRESSREDIYNRSPACESQEESSEKTSQRGDSPDDSQRHKEQQEDVEHTTTTKEHEEVRYKGKRVVCVRQNRHRDRESPFAPSPLSEVCTVQSSGSSRTSLERPSSNPPEGDPVQVMENREPQSSPEASDDDEGTRGSTVTHPLRYLERNTYTAERAGFKQVAPFIRFPNGETFLHPPLPPGWQVSVCTSSERAYYWHPDFGRTYFPPMQLPSADGKIHGYTPRFIVHCEGTIPPPNGFDVDLDIGYDYEDSEQRQTVLSNASSHAESRESITSPNRPQEASESGTPSDMEHGLGAEAGVNSDESSQKSPGNSSRDYVTDKSDHSQAFTPRSCGSAPIQETPTSEVLEGLTPEQDRSQKHDENIKDSDEGSEIVVHQRESKRKSETPLVAVQEASNTATQESQSPVVLGTPDRDEERGTEQEMEHDEGSGPRSEDLSSQNDGKEQGEDFGPVETAQNGESRSPSEGNEQSPSDTHTTEGYSPVAFDDSPINSGEDPLTPLQVAEEVAHAWPSFVSVPRSNGTPVGSEQDSQENVSLLGDGGASTIHHERHWERESQSLGERSASVAGSIASRISYRVMHPPMPVCCLQNIGSLEMYNSSSKKRKKETRTGKKKRAKCGMHGESQLVM